MKFLWKPHEMMVKSRSQVQHHHGLHGGRQHLWSFSLATAAGTNPGEMLGKWIEKHRLKYVGGNGLKPFETWKCGNNHIFPGFSRNLKSTLSTFAKFRRFGTPLASCSWRLAQFYCLGVMVTVLRCYSSVLVLSSWENPMGWWLSLPYTIKLWAIWWKNPWKSTIKWFYRCFFRHFGMDIGHSSHLQHHGWKRSQVPSHRLWGGQIAGFRRRNMPKSFAPGLWRDSGERLWDSPWKMVV